MPDEVHHVVRFSGLADVHGAAHGPRDTAVRGGTYGIDRGRSPSPAHAPVEHDPVRRRIVRRHDADGTGEGEEPPAAMRGVGHGADDDVAPVELRGCQGGTEHRAHLERRRSGLPAG